MSDFSLDPKDFDDEIDKEMNVGMGGRRAEPGRKMEKRYSDLLFDIESEISIQEFDDNYRDKIKDNSRRGNKKNDRDYFADISEEISEDFREVKYTIDKKKNADSEQKNNNYKNNDDANTYNEHINNKDSVKKQNEIFNETGDIELEDSHFLSLDDEHSFDNKLIKMKPAIQDESIISNVSLEIVNESIMKIFEYLEGDKKNEDKLIKRLAKFEEKLDKHFNVK